MTEALPESRERLGRGLPLAGDCRGLETCAGFYEMLLDVTVMRSVPGLWLETQSNYDSIPARRCGLLEMLLLAPFPGTGWAERQGRLHLYLPTDSWTQRQNAVLTERFEGE